MKFNVEKRIKIDASDSDIFNQFADLNNWENWSPWAILEDGEIMTVGEPKTVGHKMSWEGEITGSGDMTLEKVSDNRIDFKTNFIKPFKSVSQNSISVKDGEVVWTMEGNLPIFMFFMKKMMEAFIGMDFERGLLMLKDFVETGELKTESLDEGISDMKGFSWIGIEKTTSIEEMPNVMKEDMTRIGEMLENNHQMAEKWIGIYKKYDPIKNTCNFISAVSSENFDEIPEGYISGEYKTGKVFKVLHKGDYKYLGNSWTKSMMTVRTRKKKKRATEFENYLNDPTQTEVQDLRTEIIYPVK